MVLRGKKVLATGLGVLSPIGNSAAQLWSSLNKKSAGCDLISKFDNSNCKTYRAFEIKSSDFSDDAVEGIGKKMDQATIYAMQASHEAWVDSGLQYVDFNKFRCGVFWGSAIGGIDEISKSSFDFFSKKVNRLSPYLISRSILNTTPSCISIKYGIKGPSFTSVAACASSSIAIANAIDAIESGTLDFAIVGGSEAPICELVIKAFESINALSTTKKNNSGASRPFDKDRDGFVMSEGAACMVLESYDHALARGAKVYAEIAGYGLSSDAHHIVAPDPTGESAAYAMESAISRCDIEKDEINYINAHATSTILGDSAELRAILKVFGSRKIPIVNSTKSMTGHLLGASGVIEAVISILSLYHQMVPPTVNFSEADDEFNDRINFGDKVLKKAELKSVLSNSFGFGGHNVCIVLRKYK